MINKIFSDNYLFDCCHNVFLSEINGILYTWRWNTINWIAGKVLQNDLLHCAPNVVEVNVIEVRVFPCTADTCTVNANTKQTISSNLLQILATICMNKISNYLNKRSSISGKERYSSSTKSTNEERVVFSTRKSFNPLIIVGRISTQK